MGTVTEVQVQRRCDTVKALSADLTSRLGVAVFEGAAPGDTRANMCRLILDRAAEASQLALQVSEALPGLDPSARGVAAEALDGLRATLSEALSTLGLDTPGGDHR